VCNDDNVCTTDSCGANGECVFAPSVGTTCNDANACTSGDACTSQGACVGATAVSCGTDTSCVDYSCNTSSGCVTTILDGQTCSDGSLCTTGDKCQGSGCVGVDITCNDNNPCTTDTCDAASGCKFTAQTGTTCSDGNACTAGDSCQAGACTNTGPTACDDSNPCTANLCNIATGCNYPTQTGTECSDGNFCTVSDVCTAGVCGGTTRNCDDGKVCTTDSCINTSGCSNEAATGSVCDDGNPCTTTDKCNSSAACVGVATTCNDNNVCTVDSCSTISGCTYTNIQGAVCDDGLFCTVSDACNATASCVGQARDCDEGNVCTTNSCNETNDVCTSVNNTIVCTDGNPCTINDACSGGACVAVPKVCNDANGCTSDSCQEGSCLFEKLNDGTSCETKQGCTIGTCEVGTCLVKQTYWKQELTDFALSPGWAFDATLEQMALQDQTSIYLYDSTGSLESTWGAVAATFRTYKCSHVGYSVSGGDLAASIAVAGVNKVVVGANSSMDRDYAYEWSCYSSIHLAESSSWSAWEYSVVPVQPEVGVFTHTVEVRVVSDHVLAWGYLKGSATKKGQSKLWMARIPLSGSSIGRWYVEFQPISQTSAVDVQSVFFESDGQYVALRTKYLGDSGTVTTPVFVRSFTDGSFVTSFTPVTSVPMVFQSGSTLNGSGERWNAATGAFIGRTVYPPEWLPPQNGNGVVMRDLRDGLTSVYYDPYDTNSLRGLMLQRYVSAANSSITTPVLAVSNAKALSDESVVTWGVASPSGRLYGLRTDPWFNSTCTKCFDEAETACSYGPCERAKCTGTETTISCVGGVDGTCDDEVACTSDFCNLDDNSCRSTGQDCDDGTVCTVSSCQTDNSCGAPVTISCDDGNSCTLDSCSPTTGCSHTPLLNGLTCTLPDSSAGYCGGTSASTVTCGAYQVAPATLCWTTVASPTGLSNAITPGTSTSSRTVSVLAGNPAVEWVRVRVDAVRSSTGTLLPVVASILLTPPGQSEAAIAGNWSPTSTTTASPTVRNLPDGNTTSSEWSGPASVLGTTGVGTWGLKLRNDAPSTGYYYPRLYQWTLELGYKCP
jgi:hypothetical protein